MMNLSRLLRHHLLKELLLRISVLLLSFKFFTRRLDPTISYKHSEAETTLLILPWSVKMAWEDLSMGSQTHINLPHIPCRTLQNSEDITDTPLACDDDRIKKRTVQSWYPPVPLEIMNNSRNFISV